MNFLWITLLTILIQINFTTPFNQYKDPNICGRALCKPGNKFKYQPGIRQEYDYTVDIRTFFAGTSKNESTIRISAKVTLNFITKCDGIISFAELSLLEKYKRADIQYEDDYETNSFASREFEIAIKQHPLRFSFHDGIISEVCPHEDEVNWVLNFKRGVLSLMHNTMTRFDLNHKTLETDVNGICETQYILIGAKGTSLIIEKSKDVSTCQNRYKQHSILQSAPYNFRPNKPTMSVMNSSIDCELSIDHQIYNSIQCDETHVFRPFSNENGGATTNIKQNLVLISETSDSIGINHQLSIEKRASLLYNHNASPKPTSGELKVSRDLLKKLCQLSIDSMHIEFADIFAKFVHVSRLLSHTALFQLYARASIICSTGKKHLLDALPYLGSSAAVQLMTDIIANNEVSKDTAHEWLLSFALIPKPDEQMLSSLINLLEHDPEDSTIPLSISSVCYSVCKHEQNCYNNHYVKNILAILEKRATDAYESRRQDRATKEMLLRSLKSLANIGFTTDTMQTLLLKIMLDEETDVEIRVSAVDTFRRFPCENVRNLFLGVLRDFNVDAEVRIASYLQIMRCPNYFIIRTIKYVLEIEEVNQVGFFMWSHLHSLLKSSNPNTVEIQGLLSDKDLGSKFSRDVRKFSHNFEGSVFFEEFNAGGGYENNIIFSPSSYIPKSAMLNLTVNLFGESINICEINTRVEGFERYLESLFGPKGTLNPKKYIKTNLETLTKRFTRSSGPRTEIQAIKSDIDNFQNVVNDKFEDPKISLGVKIFGNEIKYATYNGNAEIREALKKLNPLNHVKNIFSGKKIIYDRAGMFMDTNYIIPTGAGLPLTLNSVGTAAVKLKMYGSLRGADFMATKELDLIGDIHPSVTVDLVGTMSVDAFYANTAIKLKTNIYSSTAIEGNVKIQIPQIVSFKFSLPNDKTEILFVRSELVVMNGAVEEYQKGFEVNRIEQSLCSWPAVDQIIGLKLCADYRFPNVLNKKDSPYFILAGPSIFHTSLKKADPTAKIYLLEYKLEKTNNNSVISLVFDTPGSAIKRLLTANLTLDVQSQNLTLFLETSAGTTLAKGKYKNTPNEKYFIIGLDINGKKHFDARLSLNRGESKYGYTFEPYFYLGVNDERVAELNGTLKSISKKGISQWDIDLNFQTKKLYTYLSGYFSKSDASIATKLLMKYRFLNKSTENVNLDFQISDRSSNPIKSYHSDLRLLCSAYPQYNIAAMIRLQTAAGHLDCTLHLNHGLNFQLKNNTLVAQYVFMNTNKNEGRKLNTYLEIRKSSMQLDWKLQFRYDQTGATTDILFLIRYAKSKTILVALYLLIPPTNLLRVESKLNVTIPSFTPMILEGKLHELVASEYDIELKATWFSGHNIYARGRYQDRSTRIATNYFLKLLLHSPSFPEINLNCIYHREQTEFKIDIKVYHSNEEFFLLLKHTALSAFEVFSLLEVKYRTKVYAVTSRINLQNYRQVVLEFHIDQWRDIYLGMRSLNKDHAKELGIELKWDANRDPDQKLMASVELLNPEAYRYKSKFEVSYPGRSINGIFDLSLRFFQYILFGRLTWGAGDYIELKLNSDYKSETGTLFILNSELLTSFENWKRTSLNSRFHRSGNTCSTNGSVYWQNNQHISYDVFGNYQIVSSDFGCEFRSSIFSTIPEIPSISGSLHHTQNQADMDTTILLTYFPDKVIQLNSTWETIEEENFKELSGIMTLVSPFVGYKKGFLASEIYLFKNNHISGVVDLDLDNKEYTLTVEGHLTKITNNTLIFNITTPVVKYKEVSGRFGFSEMNKHFVAEVKTPSSVIGAELLFVVNNMSDFNIKCNLATPLDFLQNALVLGKLKKEEADFRLGWNNLQAGFAGVWYYTNLTNFEYSYKIFTPITTYEENGIVTKLKITKDVDIQFLLQLASSKVGFIVAGKSKQRLMKELWTKTSEYRRNTTKSVYLTQRLNNFYAEMNDNSQDPGKTNIRWTGDIELDTIVYPTLKGTLDIQKKNSVYLILAIITLPDGIAKISDRCQIIGPVAFSNNLIISTPYESYKEIYMNTTFDINHDFNDMNYNISLDFNYLNQSKWTEMEFAIHYIQYIADGPHELELYNGTLHIYTPFKLLPRLDINAGLELEENVCKVNFTFGSENTKVSVYGTGEVDEGIIETSLHYDLISPFLNLPNTKFRLKKDFSEVENTFDLNLEMIPHKQNKKYLVKTLWQIRSLYFFNIGIKTQLPIEPLEDLNWQVSLNMIENIKSAGVYILLSPNSFGLNATRNENLVHMDVLAALFEDRYVLGFSGNIAQLAEQHTLAGVLNYGQMSFDVSGTLNMHKGFPALMNLELTPLPSGDKIIIRYIVQPQKAGYAVQSVMQQGKNQLAKIEVHLSAEQEYCWNMFMTIDTVLTKFKTGMINAKLNVPSANNMSLLLNVTTPFKGFEITQIRYSLLASDTSGKISFYHEMPSAKSDINMKWTWILMEHMAIKLLGYNQASGFTRDVSADLFYINKARQFRNVSVGAEINVNKEAWLFGSNLTLLLNSWNNFDLKAHLKLPQPNFDIYSVACTTNTITKYEKRYVSYLAKYYTLRTQNYYSISGNVYYIIKEIFNKNNHIDGNLQLNWGPTSNYSINNILFLKQTKDAFNISYDLITPKFAQQNTFKSRIFYQFDSPYHNMSVDLFYPQKRQITNLKLDYSTVTNMHGYVNISTPFKGMKNGGFIFNIVTQPNYNKRSFKPFWSNNSALINSSFTRTIQSDNKEFSTGVIFFEIPLATRHITKVDYSYTENPLHNEGQATVLYNRKKILEGKYICDSEFKTGYNKDIIHVEVENKYSPIGLTYTHELEYDTIAQGVFFPTMDWKHIEVYKLHNRTNFNVTAEINVKSTFTGQQIFIAASHANRTVTLNADYDVQERGLVQMSRLQLAPSVWIAYDLNITKDIQDYDSEAQYIEINVFYPRRNFTFLTSYNISNTSISSEVYLLWDKKKRERSVQASFDWKKLNDLPIHHNVEFQLKHPTFRKNVSLKGDFQVNKTRIADLQIVLEYSEDPSRTLFLSGTIDNKSNSTIRYFTYNITGSHPETNLELFLNGELDFNRIDYMYSHLHNYARYRRTFLPMEYGTIDAKVDFNKNKIEYKKDTRTETSYFGGNYSLSYPIYTANMTRILKEDIHESGIFYINVKDKLIIVDMNLSKDASQSFHIFGEVPDSRSASLNVWTDYEDISIYDIAYLLRLNHSRLIVSSFHWRPELSQDIKHTIRSTIIDFVGNFTESIDYWKQYIRSEIHDAIKDISDNAQPTIQQFIDDLKALKVLKDDTNSFIVFLNDSYNANEFYIRDIVKFGMSVIDEMSIRNHIESLPAIINEIWDVMGESGKVIQKSILWIIETIENSYKKIQLLINELMKEDAMERLIAMMERVLENYDKLMKGLHVSFIKYIEDLWDKIYVSMMNQWHKFLHSIEPTFIEFAHYIESLVYNMTKEFLDFIYIRTSEIVDSPYFNQFTNFTADIDKFYKDVTGNNSISVIYKYTKILFNFLKEKYFSIVPFGKELQNVAMEIVVELQELQKLPSIHYLTVKWIEFYTKVKWVYEYLDVENRVTYAFHLISSKITEISETALQAENRYRKAKTKFVYNPIKGIIYFQQKLPVPWHAFNETPDFKELSEITAINKLQNYFESSNFTFRTLYYYYKSYMNLEDWLPPFSARAIIAGSQHFITFDKNFYEFSGQCSHLLAHDFMDKNFSLTITYDNKNKRNSHELHLVIKDKTVVHINTFSKSITLGNGSMIRLPITIEDAFLYQEMDIFTVESKSGYTLRCNLNYDVCMFDVSGWYFGKTAGLWGTINNEPRDDFLASTKHVVPQVERFAQSWSMGQTCRSISNNAVIIREPTHEVNYLCDSLFISKVSPFQACFQRVDPKPLMKMCLNSASEMDVCTIAVAYIEACSAENTPIRIPDSCVKCQLSNGENIEEGETIQLNMINTQKSSDIVFIVEAKECNKNIRNSRNMDILISLLHKELNDTKIVNNRYALVTFGGDNVFDEPRSVVKNNNFFVSEQEILFYFDNIPSGNGNADIFNALNFATKLIFRPGVSKTFIIIPCSDCDISKMKKLDYAAIHQMLQEYAITLHILMNQDFTFEKSRINKLFFGMDREFAYTKKDGRTLTGNKDLRKQVRMPKSVHGLCIPLALETNGTVFTAKKLEGDKDPTVKKFAGVLAKRIAKTAIPHECQTCECSAHDNGISYVECFPCHYPVTPFMNHYFNEDEILGAIQPMVDDQFDSEEE